MIRPSRIRFRFARVQRLNRAYEFNLVKTSGKSWTGRYLVLATLANPGVLRIGIITTRRIGSAVVRNRVRRKIREIFRLNQHCLQSGYWLVTIARHSSARATFPELEKDWLRLAERASIMSPPGHGPNSPDLIESV
jgi:ribonuclease P protein component